MRHAAWKPLRLLPCVVALVAAVAGCGGDDASSPDGTAGAASGTVTWCEVSAVLEAKCQRCHSGAGKHGAPYPLVSFADTQDPMGGRPRWEFMRSMVEADAMPPPNVMLEPPAEKPTRAEKAVLLTWFEEGAKAVGGQSCEP